MGDIKSNLTRSWAEFGQERIDASSKPDDFKACLFSLCWFHSIMLGRRRFGPQGWSRAHSFNTGDLVICSNVLTSYIDAADAAGLGVPWADLRYIFGEIMYGGHITDAWDRRTNNTYLAELMKPELRPEGEAKVGLELGPGFPSPDPHSRLRGLRDVHRHEDAQGVAAVVRSAPERRDWLLDILDGESLLYDRKFGRWRRRRRRRGRRRESDDGRPLGPVSRG